MTKSDFQFVSELDRSAEQVHEFTSADYGTLSGNVIYLNPFITAQTKENIFKQATREYPVDFGTPIEKTYITKITLPEGFNVDELPKPKVV